MSLQYEHCYKSTLTKNSGDLMNILGINGSHRKNENTFKALTEALHASNADAEIVQISDLHVEPCRACFEVCSKEPYTCVQNDDLHSLYQKMVRADGLILASPLYSPVLVPSRLATFMERLSCVYFFESMRRPDGESPLSGKPCGIITVTGGSEPLKLVTLLANFVLMLHLDLVAVKHYPYFGVWLKSPVEKDENINHSRELGVSLAKRILK